MHTEVLGWDLYQVLNDDSMYSLRKVPVHFDSVDEYLDVMEPLLLEESRAQILRDLQEANVVEGHLQLRGIDVRDESSSFRMMRFEAPHVPPRAAVSRGRPVPGRARACTHLQGARALGERQREVAAVPLVAARRWRLVRAGAAAEDVHRQAARAPRVRGEVERHDELAARG